MRFVVYVFLLLFLSIGNNCAALSPSYFHHIYPFNSFKKVIDTCMRSYGDALALQDRITNRERYDDTIDLLVGRLIRLQSYIQQVIYAYQYEATVTFDELDYLLRMLDYLELTIAEGAYKDIIQGLNSILNQLKTDLKQVLGLISCADFIPAPLHQHQYRSLKDHLPRLT
jgi:hypothetical protein